MATAALSPNIIKSGSETTGGGAATPTTASYGGVKSPSAPLGMTPRYDTKSLRGLNKPKCITCGNVARSRCPFQSCKNCCAKAQNPCPIHVLKANATIADRGPSTNSTPTVQKPSEAAPTGPFAKTSSIRQLPSTYSQFNNLHIPLRSRKPLSVKEAVVLNEWRFATLTEYKESNVEAENEAFDRYMQNISLLEEVLDMNSSMPNDDSCQLSNLPTTQAEKAEIISEMKAKLRSNPVRVDTFRKRIRQTVDLGLRNLQFYDPKHGSINLDDGGEPITKTTKNWWGEKTSALTKLNDKLNTAQNKEDLKTCVQKISTIKDQANSTSQEKTEDYEILKESIMPNDMGVGRGSGKPLLKFVRATEIDQDTLDGIEFYFSSMEEIEDL